MSDKYDYCGTCKNRNVADICMHCEPVIADTPTSYEYVYEELAKESIKKLNLSDYGVVDNSVVHPTHYNKGKIEVWDAIADWDLDFDMGSAVKYIVRADHKGRPVEDLNKAIEFLKHEIEQRKGEN